MEDFIVKEKVDDLGVALYEKSNAKTVYDAPIGKIGAKGWAQRVYMLVLGAALLGWFLYSAIASANFAGHVGTLIVLVLAELILMLTAFGGWGKFARATLKHRELTRQHRMEGLKTRMLEEEFAEADENKANENAVRVYRDYIVVINNGEEITLSRSELARVECNIKAGKYQLAFIAADDSRVVADELIPFADLPLIKKHFRNFEYTRPELEKGYMAKKFPLLGMMFVPVLIGVALILLHSLVLHEMPLAFGVLFLAFGLLLIIGQFSDIAVVGHGIMPIGGGLIIMAMPLLALKTIADFTGAAIATLLMPFTAVHAVLGLFFGFGPMLIILGIAGIADCAKI